MLFVCSANKQRSKTAEDYFSEIYPEIIFSSAGTNIRLCQKEGTNPLNEKMLNDATTIFVMENKHKKELEKQNGNSYLKKVVILNIPDIYKYYQPELIEILEHKMASFI